jgi:hypothetical protein
MEPAAVSVDLALPRPPDVCLTNFRRRVLRAESSGLELVALRNGCPPANGLKSRNATRDALAECLAFAARWEAPLPAWADDPDGPETCPETSDQPVPAL